MIVAYFNDEIQTLAYIVDVNSCPRFVSKTEFEYRLQIVNSNAYITHISWHKTIDDAVCELEKYHKGFRRLHHDQH